MLDRTSGAAIPVGGVVRVAFSAVQIGVDPRAVRRVDVLGEGVRPFPVTHGVEPQRPQQRRCVRGKRRTRGDCCLEIG